MKTSSKETMKLLVYMMIFIFTFTGFNCDIQQLCDEKDTNQCYLCGFDHNRHFNINCGENRVIQIEAGGYPLGDDVNVDDTCPLCNFTDCRQSSHSYEYVSSYQDRIEVYKRCTFKNSCEIDIKDKAKMGEKHVLNYPYYCHDRSIIEIISNQIDKKLTNPMFYFTGENYAGRINCECLVSGSFPLEIEIFFKHLNPSSCSNVHFLSTNHKLFGCQQNSDTTSLWTLHRYIGSDFKLEIRDMEPEPNDVIFFRIWGEDLAVHCTGCTNSIDAVATDNADQSNDVYIIFGGTLAGIVVLNIIGIAIYCVIRKRRVNQNPSTDPNIAAASPTEYAHADTHPSTGAETPNYLDLINN